MRRAKLLIAILGLGLALGLNPFGARAQAQARMQQFAMQQEAAKTGAEVMSKLPPEAAEGMWQ